MESCKVCGEELVEEANFCIICGAEVQVKDHDVEQKEPVPGEIVIDEAGLYFFESGPALPPSSEWKYDTRFPREEVRYVNCTIMLKHPPAEENRDFELGHFFYGPNDKSKALTSGKDKFLIGANYLESNHTLGCGWETPGNWDTGTYYVEITMDDEVIASSEFEIFT